MLLRMSDASSQPSEEGLHPLTVPHGYRPKRAEDVFAMDMEDGLILYNRDSQLVHHLNPTAAIVWGLADGEASVAILAEEIAEQYELDPAETLGQIVAMLGELDAMGLVTDSGAPAGGS